MKRRSGFTLVELLVVIVTISILMTILLQVIGAGINLAREANTKSTLWRLRVQMQHKAEALQRLEMRGGFLDGTYEADLLRKRPQYANLPKNTQKLLIKKLLLGHYFPQEIPERWDAKLYPPGTGVDYALLQCPIGNWLPDDDVKMVDGWGTPILFFRWPTRLFQKHPELLPGPYNKDPDDTFCDLQGLFAAGAPFDPLMPIVMPDPCKPYVMVFVSAGPDREFGLSGSLGDVVNEEQFSDNLWSIMH